MDLKFKIGNTSQINNTEIDEGSFLVDKEKGQILIDTDDKKRIAISGGIGESVENGGEIFNDYENNQANTLYSHAEGQNTIAGAKVFWASEGSVENKTYTLDSVEGIEVGDYYSYKCVPNEEAGITYNGTFDFCGTITAINGNTVTVSNFTKGQDNAFQSGYFWIPRKPTIGTIIPELEQWQHAEGSNTTAIMGAGHAEGNNTVASGRWSHAEGKGTIAGYGSHAEGRATEARGLDSHSEGFHTVAQGEGAHAEGDHTVAKGNGAHAEGIGVTSNVVDEFAGGKRPDETYGALADGAHSEGYQTKAIATAAHSEGYYTIASGSSSHAEGIRTEASGGNSHAEGNDTKATADNAHAEGGSTIANGGNAHAEGVRTEAKATGAHSEGADTIAEGQRSHTEGNVTYAKGFASHAEGGGDSTVGPAYKQTNFGAFGDFSHSEGVKTKAIGTASHAEGGDTEAKGYASHSEGEQTKAESRGSHAEGFNTLASKDSAHAEGYATNANGAYSHAEGKGTIAYNEASHAQGKYNKITKDTLTNVSLDGVIRTDAINYITKTDNGVTWNLNTANGSNVYGFEYNEFEIGKTYKLRLYLKLNQIISNKNTSIRFFAYNTVSDLAATNRDNNNILSIQVDLDQEEKIVTGRFTFKTDGYPFLGIRFYNNSAINATVTLTKLEIVDEEIDENIISSIGNGFDEDNRSNAFVVYKDGYAEVGKMGDSKLSVATKDYVDSHTAEWDYIVANSGITITPDMNHKIIELINPSEFDDRNYYIFEPMELSAGFQCKIIIRLSKENTEIYAGIGTWFDYIYSIDAISYMDSNQIIIYRSKFQYSMGPTYCILDVLATNNNCFITTHFY